MESGGYFGSDSAGIQPQYLKCVKCGHEWIPRTGKPVQCPRCKTYKWEVKTEC